MATTPSLPATRDELSRILAVDVDDALLELALTHRSFAYENGGVPHNERLEFLGDSVLGQAVTVLLYTRYPEWPEGELAKHRASLVSATALAEVAHTLGLGRFVLLGHGEEMTGGREKDSILADTVEAIIGAVYLSAGQEQATELVVRLISPLMEDAQRFGAAMDPKTSLQEKVAQLGGEHPVYSVEAEGPDHQRTFTATVTVGSLVTARGQGTSKKQAEMAAALTAWTILDEG